MEPKLTPTFNDKAREAGGLPGHKPAAPGQDKPHIEPAHEPLEHEAFVLPTVPTVEPQPNGGGQAPVLAKAGFKVALLGTAPSSRNLAPFNDPSWKIWSCSPGNMNIPRWDEWFELHNNLLWPENQSYGVPYVDWLNKVKDKPVWMQDQSLVPHAKVFPKEELIREFGPYFFTSSFAWMLAFALKRGASEIMLYGIDMASREEYIVQRAGFYYFYVVGTQKFGARIGAPNESDIMQPPPLYGYHDASPFGRKMHARKKEIDDRIAQMEAEERKLHDNILYLKGAREDNDYCISIWGGAQTL